MARKLSQASSPRPRYMKTGKIYCSARAIALAVGLVLCASHAAAEPAAVQNRREECGFLCALGGDFRSFGTSGRTALVLGPALGLSVLSKSVDDDVSLSRINSELYPGTALDHILEPGDIGGGSAVQFGAAFATVALGKVSGTETLTNLGSALVRVQILNGVVTSAMKYTIRRRRPDSMSRTSFPSGHTSGSFASATILQRTFGWKAGIPAFAGASLVGASRLSENRHYLSDVIFGAAVGIASGLSVGIGDRDLPVEIAPHVVPDGLGVRVSLSLRD